MLYNCITEFIFYYLYDCISFLLISWQILCYLSHVVRKSVTVHCFYLSEAFLVKI